MNDLYLCPEELRKLVEADIIHEWRSESWGIYCKNCGQMRLLPELGEEDKPQTHYMDGTPINP